MRYIVVMLMMGSVLVLGGCNDTAPTSEPISGTPMAPPLGRISGLHRFDVVSAHLEIYVAGIEVPSPVGVYRITAPWTECGATWFTHSANFDPTPVAQFTPSAIGYVSLDITPLVAGWNAGAIPNFGVMLRQEMVSDNHNTEYFSSEHATFHPRLVMVLKVDGTEKMLVIERGVRGVVADTWIWSAGPGYSGCDEEKLFTRANSVYRKEVLLRFSVELSECTRTQGYWKNHAGIGRAPYDNTWGLLPDGPQTPFFSSGRSYIQVLWTPPLGRAYFILAHAYMAAKLNLLKGTSSTPEVDAAMAWADGFFGTKSPWTLLSRTERNAAVTNAEILDRYNNGLIGPGHCE